MGAYYDLGSFSWPVTTAHRDAQVWFNRGMAWCYGFNHEEAIACFERVLELDPLREDLDLHRGPG